MKLTKKKAKKICLEVWECLSDNPEIECKSNLPTNLFEKIKWCYQLCTLCGLFYVNYKTECPDCPLGSCNNKSDFQKWQKCSTKKTRQKYASIIVKKVKAWKV